MKYAYAAAAVAGVAIAGAAQAAPDGSPLTNGTYNCIVGYRTMFTAGEMDIKGPNFKFRGLGVFTRAPAQITATGKDGVVKDSFWIKYKLTPSGSEQTMSCRLKG